MTNGENHSPANDKPKYDLEERTACFGEAVIDFARIVPCNVVTTPLIGQLVRAADDAVSKKEFRNKIGTCKKEARETKFWLRMIARADDKTKPKARDLWQEAKELHLIFAAILRKG